MGGGFDLTVTDITETETEKVVTVQYYADCNKLLPSHKIAYHFSEPGDIWMRYEFLTWENREPWGLYFLEYGDNTYWKALPSSTAVLPTFDIPSAWIDDGVAVYLVQEVTEPYGDGTEPIYSYRLYEATAYQAHHTGLVWEVSVYTQDVFDAFAADIRRLHEIDPDMYGADVYVSGFGVASQVLGYDASYTYVLRLPSDVQWIENDETSAAQYHQLEEGSKALLAAFLQDNGITPNPYCYAPQVYDPSLVYAVNEDTLWDNFLQTLEPYRSNIVATEFLDLDGNGSEELLVYEKGMGICEVFTIERGTVCSLYSGEISLCTAYSDKPKQLASLATYANETVLYATPTKENIGSFRLSNRLHAYTGEGQYVQCTDFGNETQRYTTFYTFQRTAIGQPDEWLVLLYDRQTDHDGGI